MTFKPSTPPSLATLILLTACSTLSLNMFLPSLANISRELGADYATMSVAVSGYLAVTAVIQIAVGPLSDRIGRRPVLLWTLAIFAAASLGCALATDIRSFLAFRLLQGGIISGYVLSMAIVRDTVPEGRAAGTIGYISMAMALAPMLGPMLGGVLDTSFGWRSNFYLYAFAGTCLFVLCWVDVGETNRRTAPTAADRNDAALALVRSPLFWAWSLCGTFSTGAFYIFLAGAPLIAQSGFGISTAELGLYIGSITAGFMTGGFIAARWAPVFAPTSMAIAGRVIACTGLIIGIIVVVSGQVSPLTFFASTVFVGLGNGITMPSATAGALSVRPDLAGSAAGFNGAMIVAGGAAFTTAAGLVLSISDTPLVLLLLMLMASLLSLLAALWVIPLQRSDTGFGPAPPDGT